MADNDIMWLAGLLEGEGTFSVTRGERSPRYTVQLCMTDEDVVARAAAMLGTHHIKQRNMTTAGKPIFRTAIFGPYALWWMLQLRPHMGERRTRQIDDAVNLWRSRGCRITRSKFERK